MSDQQPLVNRVAASGLITINLEDFFPAEEVISFDLKDYLFMELILKEKDFRTALKEHDWTQYEGKYLAVFCSTDAIIPVWAYMLVAAKAGKIAKDVFQGSVDQFYTQYFRTAVEAVQGEEYAEKRIVIKGCSDKPVPPSAYVDLTQKLLPCAQSIMYGEPCSTVPVFKRPRVLRKK